MKIVIDMNLLKEWVPVLATHGFEAVHWSTLGSATAEDSEIKGKPKRLCRVHP